MTTWAARAVIVALLAAALSSCASRRPAVRADAVEVPPDALAARLLAHDRRIASMTGKGSVSFESPEQAGSAYFDMSLKKPDSLLVKFEGPFGIDAGFLFLSRQKFVMYNSFENRVFTGVPTPRAIRGVIPIELTFEQIMDAFTGGFRLPDAFPASYAVDGDQFRIEYDRSGSRHTYWVDPSFELVMRYERRDESGTLILEAVSSRILEKDGISVPGRVTLNFPADGRHLAIYYSSLELNAENPSFEYAIPSNARTTIR